MRAINYSFGLCPKCCNSLSVKPGLKAGWCPVCHAGLKVYHPNPWEEKKSENVEIAGKNWKVKEIDVDGVPYVMVKPLDWGITVPDGVNTFDKPAERRRYLAEARKWLKSELLAGRTPTISHISKTDIAVAGQEGIRRIPLDKIKVKTELYQYRKGGSSQVGLDLKHVDNIAKGFTPNRMTPIELRALPDGTYELLSGHHRLAAFEQNHATGGIDKYPDYDFSTIPSLVRQVDDQTAQQLARLSNAATKEYSPSELAKIVDIEVKGGMPIEDVGRIYGNRKPSEVQKLLDVAILPESLTAVLDQPAMRKVFTIDHAAVLGSAIKRYGLAPQEAKTIFDNLLSKGEYTANQLERMMTTLAPQIKEAPPDMFSGMALEKGGIINVMKDVMDNIKNEQKQSRQLSSFNNFIMGAQKAGRAIPGELVAAQKVALNELNKIRTRIKDLQYSLGQRVKAQATANPIGDWRNALKALADKIERRARRNPSLPAKAGEAATKEPWMMTKSEYATQRKGELQKLSGISERMWDNALYEASLGQEASVKQALSEGKPVPAEVLKNYPDLAKHERKAQKMSTGERQGKLVQRSYRTPVGIVVDFGIQIGDTVYEPRASAVSPLGVSEAKKGWSEVSEKERENYPYWEKKQGKFGNRARAVAGIEKRWDEIIAKGKTSQEHHKEQMASYESYMKRSAEARRLYSLKSSDLIVGMALEEIATGNTWVITEITKEGSVYARPENESTQAGGSIGKGEVKGYRIAIQKELPTSGLLQPRLFNPQLNKPIPMFQEPEKIPFTPEAGMQKGFTETGEEFFQEYRPEGKGEAERMSPQDIYALGQWERTMGKRTPRIASKFGYRPGQKWIKWNPERLKS